MSSEAPAILAPAAHGPASSDFGEAGPRTLGSPRIELDPRVAPASITGVAFRSPEHLKVRLARS